MTWEFLIDEREYVAERDLFELRYLDYRLFDQGCKLTHGGANFFTTLVRSRSPPAVFSMPQVIDQR
jgi:hypothetical protein